MALVCVFLIGLYTHYTIQISAKVLSRRSGRVRRNRDVVASRSAVTTRVFACAPEQMSPP